LEYILAVDGNNNKTDYLLCTMEGNFVDALRADKILINDFDSAEQSLKLQLGELLGRNSVSYASVVSAGFGLIGANLPSQITELETRIKKIGLTNFRVANNGILGIKAASNTGVGLCAVNSTSTLVIGSDERRQILQVGGLGFITSDFAGGTYIRDKIMAALYDFNYRCGENSEMFTPVLELLQVDNLQTAISDNALLEKHNVNLIKIADKAAREGDKVAQTIFDEIGLSIGKSVAGCIKKMHFEILGKQLDNPIEIILIGTIWNKVIYPGMIRTFLETVQNFSGKICRAIPLKSPPAVGGILWAREIISKPASPEYREKLLNTITLDFYEKFLG